MQTLRTSLIMCFRGTPRRRMLNASAHSFPSSTSPSPPRSCSCLVLRQELARVHDAGTATVGHACRIASLRGGLQLRAMQLRQAAAEGTDTGAGTGSSSVMGGPGGSGESGSSLEAPCIKCHYGKGPSCPKAGLSYPALSSSSTHCAMLLVDGSSHWESLAPS